MKKFFLLKHRLFSKIKRLLICSLLIFGLNTNYLLGQRPSDNINYFQVGFSSNVFNGVLLNDAIASAKVLAEFFLKQYADDNYEVKTPMVFSAVDELRKIIEGQEFDVLVMHPSEFIQVRKSDQLEPIAVAWRSGSPYDSYYLLVHKDSKYKECKDLRKKSLLICSLEGKKAELWIDHLLNQKKLDGKEKFFSKLEFTDKPLPTILPVFLKKEDACIIDKSLYNTVSELNPQISSDLIAIEISEPLAIKVVTVRKSIHDLQEKANIKKAFLDMHTFEEARQYLRVFRIGKVIEYKEEYLNSTYDIMGLTK